MMMPVSIETRWGKFLTIKCFHEYYKDGKCPDLRFVATTDTEYLMKNFRILFRKQNDGYILLFDKFQTHNLLNSPVLSKIIDKKMVFYIFNDNNLLNHISNIDFEKGESIYYFNNISNQSSKENEYHINDNKNLESHKVIAKRKSFSISFTKPILTKDLIITDEFGNKYSNKSISNLEEKEQKTTHHIVLDYAEEGKYYIKSNNETQCVYCTGNGFDHKVWGIIEIYLNAPNNKALLYDNKAMLSPTFKIEFDARFTYWKYLLIGRFTDINNINEIKITYESKEIEFTKPKMIDLISGGKAVMIESVNNIKTSELLFSNDTLSMKIKIDNKWNSKLIAIQKPSIDMIKPDRENGKIYSVAYIYV